MPDRLLAAAPAAANGNTGKPGSGTDEKGAENPDKKRRVTMQNTYRLESKAAFDGDRVSTLVEQIMQEMMGNAQYDVTANVKLAEQVAAEILTCVKEMNFDRYRIIVIVSVYEKMLQGIVTRFNALWDAQRDDCVTCTFCNSSIVAEAIVCGIYYD